MLVSTDSPGPVVLSRLLERPVSTIGVPRLVRLRRINAVDRRNIHRLARQRLVP